MEVISKLNPRNWVLANPWVEIKIQNKGKKNIGDNGDRHQR